MMLFEDTMMLFEDTITLRKDENGVYRVVER